MKNTTIIKPQIVEKTILILFELCKPNFMKPDISYQLGPINFILNYSTRNTNIAAFRIVLLYLILLHLRFKFFLLLWSIPIAGEGKWATSYSQCFLFILWFNTPSLHWCNRLWVSGDIVGKGMLQNIDSKVLKPFVLLYYTTVIYTYIYIYNRYNQCN
jgi:hypothetical protein